MGYPRLQWVSVSTHPALLSVWSGAPSPWGWHTCLAWRWSCRCHWDWQRSVRPAPQCIYSPAPAAFAHTYRGWHCFTTGIHQHYLPLFYQGCIQTQENGLKQGGATWNCPMRNTCFCFPLQNVSRKLAYFQITCCYMSMVSESEQSLCYLQYSILGHVAHSA